MILISGITGRVGGAAAKQLIESGAQVRGLTRDPSKAEKSAAMGAEIFAADLGDLEAVKPAMSGVDRALLVVSNSQAQATLEQNFVDAAIEAGVGHIVKISSMEAGPDARAPIPKLHYASEQAIKASGIAWTFLQPNFYFQNFLMNAGTIAGQQQFHLPLGNALIAPVHTADVARAAATALSDSTHQGKTYQLTGDKLISFEEIAATFSEVLNRPIEFVDQEPEAYRQLLAKFIPNEWHVNAVATLFEEIKAGALAATTSDLRTLIDQPPITLTDFIVEYRRAFIPNG